MTTTCAALYARQSSTDTDEIEASGSIADQRDALQALVAQRGWQVAGIYEDPDAPWNALDRRRRWLDLLDDARAGRFEVVAAFDTSRLWRSVEFKLHTCRELTAAGVHTVATLGGDIPTNAAADPEGGFVGTILAAVAQLDNEMRALKVRKAHERAARAGVAWKGRRPFGYTQGRTAIVPHEAELIVEAYERVVLRRESTNSIAKDWNERGLVTSMGNPWERGTLIKMLRSPALAGWRVHGAQRYPGQWEAILSDEEHAHLVAELARRRHFSGGRGTPRLLSSSGLTRCGRCGHRLVAAVRNDGYRTYRCPPQRSQACHRVTVGAELAETEVRDRVLSVLDPKLVARHMSAAASADARVITATKTLATIEDQRAEIGRTFTRDRDSAAARAALDELERIEHDARRDLNRASVGIELLLDVAARPHTWWRQADMLDRRRLLEIVCDHIVVHPAEGRGRGWDPERIEIVWAV